MSTDICKPDLGSFRQLLSVFAAAFDDAENYLAAQPSDAYLNALLERDDIVPLVAVHEGRVIGGLVAYVLTKFEKERSEIYIYDLAVDEGHRRQGIATALINKLREIALKKGAWVIYVQADHGDEPAIKLYESLGTREDVLHFDIVP